MQPEAVVRELQDAVQIGVSRGTKSTHDFRVQFRWGTPRSRWRTPTHVHLIVDMYTKRMGNPWLTNRFVDYVLTDLIDAATPAEAFPPALPRIDVEAERRFSPLTSFGEYSVEFILTVQGLIAKAEKTNYPSGRLQREMWAAFRHGDEIYRLLGVALRRRG